MEEILASIRRIISEDDAPAADAPAEVEEPVAAAPAPAPMVVADEEPEDDDDALELTEKVETLGDLDVYSPPAPEPVAAYQPPPAPAYEPPPLAPVASGESLVSDPAASAAAAAFDKLSSSLLMPNEGRTLEDVVRELLRPLLKQWLDDNLTGIVQTAVQEEVERIARSRVR
jgi:cell pole-organizing protein PopZ